MLPRSARLISKVRFPRVRTRKHAARLSPFLSLFCLFDLFYVRVLHLYTVVYYGIIHEYLKKKKRPICIKQQRQALIMQPPLAYIVTHDTNRRHRQGGASRERAAARDQETSPAEEI